MNKLKIFINKLLGTSEEYNKKQTIIITKVIEDYEKKKEIERLKTEQIADQILFDKNRKIAKLEEKKIKATETEVQKSKIKATTVGRPWVTMCELNIDPENPQKVQSIELDWNQPFLDKLKSVGLSGTDEEIIDHWFSDVCKDMALDLYDSDVFSERDGSKKTNLPDGKSEYR